MKIQAPQKKLNNSGKKKIHASKAQIIVTGQGQILFIDVHLNYCHDMKLFRTSRRNLSKAQEILADSGYQGLTKLYPQVKTPIKSSKLHPLTNLIIELYLQDVLRLRIFFQHLKCLKYFQPLIRIVRNALAYE